MEEVGAGATDKRGDVELARIPGPLRVSDLVVVYPQGKGRINTLKPQPELSPLIFGCELERCGVAPAFIVVNRHAWRVDRKGKVEVSVMRAFPVTLELPHPRDADGLPTPTMAEL